MGVSAKSFEEGWKKALPDESLKSSEFSGKAQLSYDSFFREKDNIYPFFESRVNP